MRKYPLSDEFVQWAESLAGLLTKVETQYGGVSEMVESPGWDESKTDYALRLLTDLARHTNRLREELSDHVSKRPL